VAIIDEARSHLEKALEIDPAFERARLALAALYQKEGRLNESVELLSKTIDARPLLIEARLLLAEILIDQNQGDAAIEQLQEAANANPTDHLSRRRLAILLAEQNESKRAADLFTRVIELDPLDGDAHFRLAILLEHPDDFDRAVLLFQIAADIMPENPLPPYHLACLLLRGESTQEDGSLVKAPDPDAARKCLQTTIRLDPSNGPAHLELGLILQEDGDTLAARRHLKRATEDPRSAGFAYLEIARLEIMAGKNLKARPFLDRAVKCPRSRDEALCERAVLFIGDGKLAKAEIDLTAAVKNLALAANKLSEESDAAANKANFAKARRLNEEALDARRDQGPALGWLGHIRSQEGKPSEAISFFEKALELNPSLHETRFGLAMLLAGMDREEESLAQLEAVVETEWAHAEAHFQLGERAFAAKDRQKAEMHFMIVMDLVPDHLEASDRLKQIAEL
jgi:tetratricopeptide (TPR) repeat protein